MLMAVIAVLGVFLTWWSLISADLRLVVRSQIERRKAWIVVWALATLGIVVAWPFIIDCASAVWPSLASSTMRTEGVENVVVAVLAIIGYLLIRDGKWNDDRLRAVAQMLIRSVRNGENGTAAAVVGRFIRGYKRKNVEMDLWGPYEELLEWCFADPLFLEAFVRAETDTVARMLRAKDEVRKQHSEVLLREAFVGRRGVLVAEITTFQNNDYWSSEYSIPADCVLLRSLLGDPAVAHYVRVAIVVMEAVVEEIRAGRIAAKPSARPDGENEPAKAIEMLPLPEAGIRIIALVFAESIRKRAEAYQAADALIEITKELVETYKPDAKHSDASSREACEQLLKLICETFKELASGPKPHGDGLDKSPDSQDTEVEPPESVQECLRSLAACFAVVVQSRHTPDNVLRHWIGEVVNLYGALASGHAPSCTKFSARASALQRLILEKWENNGQAVIDLTNDPKIDVDVRAKQLFRQAFAPKKDNQDDQ